MKTFSDAIDLMFRNELLLCLKTTIIPASVLLNIRP